MGWEGASRLWVRAMNFNQPQRRPHTSNSCLSTGLGLVNHRRAALLHRSALIVLLPVRFFFFFYSSSSSSHRGACCRKHGGGVVPAAGEGERYGSIPAVSEEVKSFL